MWGDNNTLRTIDTIHATNKLLQDVYAALPVPQPNKTKACWKLFIRCITVLACWSVALADALLYAFLAAALSKSALEKLRCDTSFDRIVVDDEQSTRADQMNRHATNTLLNCYESVKKLIKITYVHAHK